MERDDTLVIFGGSKTMRWVNHDSLKCFALTYHAKKIQNKFFVAVEVYKIEIRFHAYFVLYIFIN
jgi:hypothetical protein